MSGAVRLGIVGDVMLGRLVDRYRLAGSPSDPASVWGNTLSLFSSVDLRLINLECVIAGGGDPWTQTPKVFHFRARPRAVEVLAAAGISFVSLANNHILDFGSEAVLECLERLRGAGIVFAGAGQHLEDAGAPALLQAHGTRCAIVALTDGEPAWKAGEDSPGVNFVEYGRSGLSEPDLVRIRSAIAGARERADVVIVSAHVGPNWGEPSSEMQTLAHQLIDLGADLYWGHSNHAVQGIEIYRGKPVLYSCGDFVDDYAVDPEERNDLSFFFEVRVADPAVTEVVLHPVRIEGYQVNLASGEDAAWVCGRMRDRAAAFGTDLHQDNERLVLAPQR